MLPHSKPDAGVRLTAGTRTLAYTGDSGPSPEVVTLARDADLFLAEASYAHDVPADSAGTLTSGIQAGQQAADAGVGRLLLTHLMPGTDERSTLVAAGRFYGGELELATPDQVVDLQ